jgi:hypothetical protein
VVRSVTLRLTRFQGSGTGILTYGLWDVSTPATTLNRNDGFSPAIAADRPPARRLDASTSTPAEHCHPVKCCRSR